MMCVRYLSVTQILSSCIFSFLLGWGFLYVMFLRRLSKCQVPWSFTYTNIQSSCHKHVIFVRNLSNVNIPWSFIYTFLLMSSLLPVANVRNLSGSYVTRFCIYTHILWSICDVNKNSVKQSGTLKFHLNYLLHGADSFLRRFAAIQEIPRISWNPKVHYRTHKRPPPVRILGRANPVHIPTSHLLEIHPTIIHPSMPRSAQWFLSLQFPNQDPIHPLLLTHWLIDLLYFPEIHIQERSNGYWNSQQKDLSHKSHTNLVQIV